MTRNARNEAQARLPNGYRARVLEPSPPAVIDAFMADDPAAVGDEPPGMIVVTPTSAGQISWDELSLDHPELADYSREHWLGNWKRLEPLPSEFVETRAQLHQIAFFALSPARHQVNGKIGLRYTRRGFGTPFYGEDVQARVEGCDLILQTRKGSRRQQITTVSAAANFLEVPYAVEWFASGFHDPPQPLDPQAPLALSQEAAAALADWFGFAYSVLEELRLEGLPDEEVGRVQIWSEHFDAAIEIGSAEQERRASYGASPGDAGHPDPYLYVSPWSKEGLQDLYWNATTFGGSLLPYRSLLEEPDQRTAALEFYRQGLHLLREK
jgi:hypothetical protein